MGSSVGKLPGVVWTTGPVKLKSLKKYVSSCANFCFTSNVSETEHLLHLLPVHFYPIGTVP